MEVVDVLDRCGGFASRARLVAATSRADVDRALRVGTLVRDGQGRYAAPHVSAAERTAHAMNGVLSHTSAALYLGWEVKTAPALPHVLVPRKRNVPKHLRAGIVLHRGDLGPDDVSGIATGRVTTLLQCLRTLPDDEALAIADSALRHGEEAALRRVAESARGAGSDKVRRIAAAARGEAANPFESVLRAIALTVPGLCVEPQVVIHSSHVWARPDLVDVEGRIVLEADSFEHHGSRAALRKDARRYTLLVADGWCVLRFTWEDVMLEPDYVREVVARVIGDARTEGRCAHSPAA